MRRAKQHRFRRYALGLILICCAAAPIIGGCSADNLIIGTNHDTVDPAGAKRRMIEREGGALECWVKRSPGAVDREPKAFVLMFTGQKDRADRWVTMVANAWGDKPVEVWGLNYPGAGGSPGKPRLSEMTGIITATYDAMRRNAGKDRPIFVQSASLGTVMALDLAVHRPVAGMILQNPPPLRQLLLGRYGWWNLWLIAGPVVSQIPSELDSLSNARRGTTPVVFILCDSDGVVPPYYQRKVFDAYAGPKRNINVISAGHSSPLTHEASEELARDRDWLWEQAGAER